MEFLTIDMDFGEIEKNLEQRRKFKLSFILLIFLISIGAIIYSVIHDMKRRHGKCDQERPLHLVTSVVPLQVGMSGTWRNSSAQRRTRSVWASCVPSPWPTTGSRTAAWRTWPWWGWWGTLSSCAEKDLFGWSGNLSVWDKHEEECKITIIVRLLYDDNYIK